MESQAGYPDDKPTEPNSRQKRASENRIGARAGRLVDLLGNRVARESRTECQGRFLARFDPSQSDRLIFFLSWCRKCKQGTFASGGYRERGRASGRPPWHL